MWKTRLRRDCGGVASVTISVDVQRLQITYSANYSYKFSPYTASVAQFLVKNS